MDEDLRWAVETLGRVRARLEGMLEPWPLYSQRDPRWTGDRLGPDSGGGTLGGKGCGVTCAAMIASAAGCVVTPAGLNQEMIKRGGFFRLREGLPRNLLDWARVAEFCTQLAYRGKIHWQSFPADVNHIRMLLERHGPVIAQVDFDYTDRDIDEHYVVLLRFAGEDEVEIADPWDGRRVGLAERYYNPRWLAPLGRVARVVTGVRLLQKQDGVLMVGAGDEGPGRRMGDGEEKGDEAGGGKEEDAGAEGEEGAGV